MTVVTTFLYAGLAGFGLPTIRAWLMICLVTGLLIFNKNCSSIKVLLIAICGFITLFPLSIFGASFWLSFSAVLTIWFVFWLWPVKSAGFSVRTLVLSMLRIQLSLSLLMLPIVAWQFSYVSLVSPLINLIAVPVVTFTLVPLCLLAVLCLSINLDWAESIFKIAEWILSYGLEFLTNFSQLQGASFSLRVLPIGVWILTLTAMVIMFLPYFIVSKKCLCFMCLPLLSYFLPSQSEKWKVDVLDVGQGVSVLITKNNRALIYDVGAKYPSGFKMSRNSQKQL
jgi:competence protein ComEC